MNLLIQVLHTCLELLETLKCTFGNFVRYFTNRVDSISGLLESRLDMVEGFGELLVNMAKHRIQAHHDGLSIAHMLLESLGQLLDSDLVSNNLIRVLSKGLFTCIQSKSKTHWTILW